MKKIILIILAIVFSPILIAFVIAWFAVQLIATILGLPETLATALGVFVGMFATVYWAGLLINWIF